MKLKSLLVNISIFLIIFINILPVLAETEDELVTKGNDLLNQGKNEEAIDCYNKALEIDPNYKKAWDGMGNALYNLNKNEEAIKCFNRALEIDPDDGDAWNGKGNILCNMNKNEEAIKCYDKALDIDSNYFGVWYNKGNVLLKSGKYEEAIKCYDNALKINPDYSCAWNNKGNALYAQDKNKEAIECYDNALKIDPRYKKAWNGRGNTLYNLNKNEEAISCYDKALEIDPNDADAWNGRAAALGKLDKNEEAIKCLDKVLEIAPKYKVAWYNKGNALYKLDKNKEAIKCYDKVLEIDPNYAGAWYGKGVILSKSGKYEEAISYFNRALEIDPAYVKSWLNKGSTLNILKRYEEAVKCFDKALEIDPNLTIAQEYKKEALKSISALKNNNNKMSIKILEPLNFPYEIFKNNVYVLHITGIATSDNTITKVLIDNTEVRISPVSKKFLAQVPSRGKSVQFEGDALLAVGNNQIKILIIDKSKNKKEEIYSVYREEYNLDMAGENSMEHNSEMDSKNSNIPSIEIKLPHILSDKEPLKISDNRLTLEGIAKADNGLEVFEISAWSGQKKENPDWKEKGPRAVGKQEYFFSRDVDLQIGLNTISIRIVDSTGKETIKTFSVIYTPKEGEKWGVVIGIGEYANSGIEKLKYSPLDAQSIYDYLITKGGFQKDHVLLLLNEKATLEELKTAMGIFLQEKAKKDDLVFIYYSGHGAPEINPNSRDGDGLTKYIVTYDAKPDKLFATALPMEDINTIFGRIAAKQIVFFIDSCYSGASGGKTFCGENVKAGNISDNFLNQLSSASGRIIITASSANEVALESEKLGHGLFTYFLLEGLNGKADSNGNSFITVDELYQYIYNEVSEESKNKQHPTKKGECEGEIILGH